MEIITIKIYSETAKAYREAETKQQENATKICNLTFKTIIKTC